MRFKRDMYHNQRININNMNQVHSKRNVYQRQCLNIGIMIMFMKAHKCVPIVMQIGLAICMIANPHQVMFSYSKKMLLI